MFALELQGIATHSRGAQFQAQLPHKIMQSLAERVPYSGWWVAKTKPSKALQFSKKLEAQHYIPLKKIRRGNRVISRPLFSYVFIRAAAEVNAWMCPGFSGWLLSNGRRATVPDADFENFRSSVELEAHAAERKPPKNRLILRINANTEIRASL